MKIAVIGIGYVGLSNAILLAQHNEVIAVDLLSEKVEMIKNGMSPIVDFEAEDYLRNKSLNLTATTNLGEAIEAANYVIIATPTDYDPETNHFNAASLETVIKSVNAVNSDCTIVIKSTVPVGYTRKIRKELNCSNIVFSPEFLREGLV